MTHSPTASPASTPALKHFGYFCHPTDAMVDSNNNSYNNNYNPDQLGSPVNSSISSSCLGSYDRFELDKRKNNEIINLIDINKYSNLGLSLNSQELIGEYYQLLVNSNDLAHAKPFEEIIYAVVEDIQVGKRETHRLESSIKADKERHEEILKHMIEEADHQLSQATEMIKQERRREKEQFEKTIEKLKEHFNMEIYNLQDSLDKMKQMEAKYEEHKNKDAQRLGQLNDEIRSLIDENENLKRSMTESSSLAANLKNKINQLEQDAMNEDAIKKHSTREASIEIQHLRDELRMLTEEHQKMVDKNDSLKEEIENLKNANNKSAEATVLSKDMPNNVNLSEEHHMNHSGLFSPNFQASIESDEDTDFQENRRSLNHHQRTPTKSHLNVDKRKRNLSESHSSEIEESQEVGGTKSERISLAKKLLTEKLESKTDRRSKIAKLVSLSSRTKSMDSALPVQVKEKLPEKVLRIAVIGDQAVGKTSFVTRYCKGQLPATLSSTLGVDFHMKMLDLDGKAVALQLWDTCGQERFRSIAKSYFRRADGIVLMYDCNYERSFLNMREWIQIINDSNDKRIPIILVGNKTDLRESSRATSTKPCVEYEDGWKLAKEFGTLFVETSAKEGTNMEESLIELSRQMSCNQDIELKSDSIRLGANEKKKKTCC